MFDRSIASHVIERSPTSARKIIRNVIENFNNKSGLVGIFLTKPKRPKKMPSSPTPLVPTPTLISMHNPPIPPKIPTICRNMILPIQSLTLFRNLTHPPHLLATHSRHFKIRAFLPQLTRNSINIHAQIIPQKLSNLSILVIAYECFRSVRVRGVDIYVCGAVAVRTPPGLAAAGHHVCVLVQCGRGVLYKVVDFIERGVEYAQSVFDLVFDEIVLLLVGRRVGEVRVVTQGHALGGVAGVGER